jgi:transposase InsO family protein
MDDHSRFITGYGLHASQSAALVLEVLRAAITSYGNPAEILTDNGTQYVTWRGKSAFARELEKRGVRHVVASPRRPQTLGKIERLGDAWRAPGDFGSWTWPSATRIGLHRPLQLPAHQGADGSAADRFFGAARSAADVEGAGARNSREGSAGSVLSDGERRRSPVQRAPKGAGDPHPQAAT